MYIPHVYTACAYNMCIHRQIMYIYAAVERIHADGKRASVGADPATIASKPSAMPAHAPADRLACRGMQRESAAHGSRDSVHTWVAVGQ
jgi:hypothetical protein